MLVLSGAVGLIGTQYVDRLFEEDHKVLGLDSSALCYEGGLQRFYLRDVPADDGFGLVDRDVGQWGAWSGGSASGERLDGGDTENTPSTRSSTWLRWPVSGPPVTTRSAMRKSTLRPPSGPWDSPDAEARIGSTFASTRRLPPD